MLYFPRKDPKLFCCRQFYFVEKKTRQLTTLKTCLQNKAELRRNYIKLEVDERKFKMLAKNGFQLRSLLKTNNLKVFSATLTTKNSKNQLAQEAEVKSQKDEPRPLYLDAQSTTPMDPRVLDAMLPYMTSYYGNPHSR